MLRVHALCGSHLLRELQFVVDSNQIHLGQEHETAAQGNLRQGGGVLPIVWLGRFQPCPPPHISPSYTKMLDCIGTLVTIPMLSGYHRATPSHLQTCPYRPTSSDRNSVSPFATTRMRTNNPLGMSPM